MSEHTVVWIDHKEARSFRIQPDVTTEATVHAPHLVHRHSGGSDHDKDHPESTRRFFQEVAHSLADTDGIVVVGPASAKLEFIKYVHKHDHLMEPKLIGVETMDHPTDAQIVAYAKQYFNLPGRPTTP